MNSALSLHVERILLLLMRKSWNVWKDRRVYHCLKLAWLGLYEKDGVKIPQIRDLFQEADVFCRFALSRWRHIYHRGRFIFLSNASHMTWRYYKVSVAIDASTIVQHLDVEKWFWIIEDDHFMNLLICQRPSCFLMSLACTVKPSAFFRWNASEIHHFSLTTTSFWLICRHSNTSRIYFSFAFDKLFLDDVT